MKEGSSGCQLVLLKKARTDLSSGCQQRKCNLFLSKLSTKCSSSEEGVGNKRNLLDKKTNRARRQLTPQYCADKE